MSAHDCSKRRCASTCCTNSSGATSVGSAPTGGTEGIGQGVGGVGGQHEGPLAA